MDKLLSKTFKKYPDAFWLDVILYTTKISISGKVGFNEKAINYELNRICQESKAAYFFETQNIPIYISKLLADNNIEPVNSEALSNSYKITHKGISHIMIDNGYLQQARQSNKESKRFDFEFYKIGYDTIVSTIALILSIIAILMTVK